ncbi:MAG: PQQ-dependent sugar dehydrogenase [Candidatus Nitrosocosmicus sp.]|nr:PQQ-dependent sugar dehydrogenase [Candidatus Nitrosocosmicus sp.]
MTLAILLILLSTPAILAVNIDVSQSVLAQGNTTSNDENSMLVADSPGLGDNTTNNNNEIQSMVNNTSGSNNTDRIPSEEGFSTTIFATNLSAPHNILYGPDGLLWITERIGKNLTIVDPDTGAEVYTIPVPGVHQSQGQDGLMGMAFDPNYNNTHHIYLAYTYDADPSDELERLTKITRFTFDSTTGSINEPVDLISGLKGSVDHNSGRMVFGPDGKLYYTIGDQGKNQLSLYCLNIEAQTLPTTQEIANQNWTAYQGKVLRMNPDGSIPSDNPVINGVQSHIFTYGHRNPQGLVVGPSGDLYISEHGPDSDDEINHLIAGGNYGWPYVAGFKDENAYRYLNWSSTGEQCPNLDSNNVTAAINAGATVKNESEFNAQNFVPPVATFFTVDNNYNFSDHNCGKLAYICNPTIAPSSLDLYTSDYIPGWNGTFLMTTLKAGKIYQLTVNENGTGLAQDPVELFHSENRYRDLAFSPDGSTLYVITDSSGPAQAIEGGATTDLWNPGSILAFKYEGP